LIRCFAIGLALLAFVGGFARPAAAQTQVRVLVAAHLAQAVVAAAGGLDIRPYEAGAEPLLTPEVTTVIDVRPQSAGLLLAGSVQTPAELLISPLAGSTLTLDGLPYRGSMLIVRESDAALRVINLVDLEKYLYSVVGSEVNADTPPAALQAQAIVARTYAVARLGSHEDLGFDLHAGDLDQAYNGVSAESESVVDAVDATRGVVMVWGNHLVNAYYSACDGGFTSDGGELRDPEPYLQAVRDPYCPFSPYMAWTADVPAQPLVDQLVAAGAVPKGLAGASLTGVRPGATDDSGRLVAINLVTRDRIVTVAATEFRSAAGTRIVKSTRIQSLSYGGGIIHVTGSGYGHGVGMCQLGARGMAQDGLGVYAIINFYYPGVLLTQLASYQRYRLAHHLDLRVAARPK
jgi:stage II sporulation protein D